MEVWRDLWHPNVLPFIGPITLESKLYMVSPWMENGDARVFVRRNPNVNRSIILLQIARGLQYLHSRNPAVVHGDLKAANVLISNNGEARIADFGLSRATDISSAGYSTGWRVAGNARWQAPELLQDSDSGQLPQRTKESDVFAFGRVMIEIYTGEVPFFYLRDMAVLVSLVKGILIPNRPTEPEVISRGLNDRMWEIVKDCCSQHPAHRLTVGDLVHQLWLAGGGVTPMADWQGPRLCASGPGSISGSEFEFVTLPQHQSYDPQDS